MSSLSTNRKEKRSYTAVKVAVSILVTLIVTLWILVCFPCKQLQTSANDAQIDLTNNSSLAAHSDSQVRISCCYVVLGRIQTSLATCHKPISAGFACSPCVRFDSSSILHMSTLESVCVSCALRNLLLVSGRTSCAVQEPSHCPHVNITVGYNIFIWPPQDWRFLVGSQLQDLADSGLHECAQMIIAISVPEQHVNHTYLDLQLLMQQAVSFVRDQDAGKDAVIIQQHENLYEYPAIHSLYRIAMSEKNDAAAHNHLFVYFHTKGMVNHGVMTERVDRDIFNATIVPWRALVQQFLNDDSIRLAGYLPSLEGLIWRNFWWARGDWVRKLPTPPMNPPKQGRWYWEYWVQFAPRELKNKTKVFSTCSCDTELKVLQGGVRVEPECTKLEWTPDRCLP